MRPLLSVLGGDGVVVQAKSPRLRNVTLLSLALVLALVMTPGFARGASVDGGALNSQGERSHNVMAGWPDITFTWEGLVKDKISVGPRLRVQIWPLSLSVGVHMRYTLLEKGRVSLALMIRPVANVAGFGGSRAVYPMNYQWGRTRTFRPSFGPGVNAGLLATVDLSPRFHLLLSLENPVAVWFWVSPVQWWVEWPIVLSGGVEYEISYSASLIARVGGGPAIAFAGMSQLLGVNGHVSVGVQVRY